MEQQSLQNAYKHQGISEQVNLQREEEEIHVSSCPNCGGGDDKLGYALL